MGASQDAQFSEARSRHAIDLMEGGRRKCVYFDRRRPNGYSLSRPVEGLSGPRHYPFATATGTSSWRNFCSFNCPSINLTSTKIPRDARSSDHQYRPSCVGEVVVRGRGACDGLSFDVRVMLGRLGRQWEGVKDG